MSADAWDPCPRCTKRRENKALAAQVLAADAYGKVLAVEWQKMTAAADALGEPGEPTLRQDFGQGVHPDGHFYVEYRASCTDCGYSFEFEYEKDFPE